MKTENHRPEKSRKELLEDILRLEQLIPKVPYVPQIFKTDSTPEALQGLLDKNGGRISILADEGILLPILAGLYSDGVGNIDVVNQGYSGDTIRVERLGRSVSIHKPAISLGLAIQVQVFQDLKGASRQSLRGRGLQGRMLFCMPKSNIGERNVRSSKAIPFDVKATYSTGIKVLCVRSSSCELESDAA